jgi:hypothetical protein
MASTPVGEGNELFSIRKGSNDFVVEILKEENQKTILWYYGFIT